MELGKVFLLFQPGLKFRRQIGNHPFAAPRHNGQGAPPGSLSGGPGLLSQTALDVPPQHILERCPLQGSLGLDLAEQVIWQIQCRSHNCILPSKHLNVKAFLVCCLPEPQILQGIDPLAPEALRDVQSALRFHIETFGREVLESQSPVLDAFVAEATV
jgi:hypothetical protein